jgi:hydroxyacylglutathione hydrolase
MVTVKKFVFNDFQVNTYLLFDSNRDCVIIDAACYSAEEKDQLTTFIKENKLKLVRNINTHCHIDHILGNGFIAEEYGIFPEYHEESVVFFLTAQEIGRSFGYDTRKFPDPEGFIQQGDTITYGENCLKVLYTPGHADGSVCFYDEKNGFVVTGDVLFRDTIGRTDLPTGNFDLLMKSIGEKLFVLPDETIVYAGHGPETTIGYEKRNNQFIR